MSILKIENHNIKNIKNNFNINISYEKNDVSTHIFDNDINSKNILPTQEITGNSISQDLNNYNSMLRYYNSKNKSFSDFLFLKNNLKSINISNDNICLSNFKNNFNIERLSYKHYINSDFHNIKRTVKNNIYNSYKNRYVFYYNRDLEYGFCNYNNINLTCNNKNKVHDNAIVYCNDSYENKNTYDFKQKLNNTFSFRFITRKGFDERINCALNIDNYISVCFTKSNIKEKMNRICILTGEKTRLQYDDLSINLNNDNEQLYDDEYISSSLFKNNHWYTISILLKKDFNNNLNISLYVDAKLIKNFIINNSTILKNSDDSLIFIGNKPNYKKNNEYVNITEKLTFDQVFNYLYDQNDTGSIINKGILLKNTISNDKKLSDYIEEEITILKNDNNSFSFIGELSDIRIYNEFTDDFKIKEIHESFVNNIQDEKNLGLIFYLPVFFINEPITKEYVIDSKGNKLFLKQDYVYNNVLMSNVGGFELNYDQFLIELCQIQTPNVIFNGNNVSSFYKDNTNNALKIIFDENEYKKGRSLNEQLNNKFFDYIDSLQESSIISKNKLILPCDNGIPNVNFDAIENYITKTYAINIDSDGINNKGFISCENIINRNLYKFDIINYENMINDTYEINLNINNQEVSFKTTNDIFSDISNINFYSDEIIDENKLNYLNDRFFNLYKRLYNKNTNNIFFRESINMLNESNMFYENIDSISYNETEINIRKYYLSLNDVLKDYDSQMITIFNISNKIDNNNIIKNTLYIKDDKINSYNNEEIILSEEEGKIYRAECLTKQAKWNFIGHIFHNEGIIQINNPIIANIFGVNNFKFNAKARFKKINQQIDIKIDRNVLDLSQNTSYNENAVHDVSSLNNNEKFVYISDINLHDEEFNIISKAKIVNPIPKKLSDRFAIRLKMDF